MYDELVATLRRQCVEMSCGNCNTCVNRQAADAIEELSATISKMEKATRWIPVTERLPRPWWPVLGLMQFVDKEEPPAQQVLWYLGNGHWRETWKGDMVDCNVTHWMPLPEPPKEET